MGTMTNTNTLFSQLKVARTVPGDEDPAIDLTKTDLVKYLESRDAKDLVLLEGKTPDWFVLDRLSTMTVASLSDKALGLELKAITAFLAGCHRIELSDGSVLEPTEYLPGNQAKVAKESWVNTVADEFGLPTIVEMGKLILKISSLGKRSKKALF